MALRNGALSPFSDLLVKGEIIGNCIIFLFWLYKCVILSGCDDHPPIENGSFTLSHDNRYLSRASYSCIQNFFVVGDSAKTCYGGPWLDPFPVCQSMYDLTFMTK